MLLHNLKIINWNLIFFTSLSLLLSTILPHICHRFNAIFKHLFFGQTTVLPVMKIFLQLCGITVKGCYDDYLCGDKLCVGALRTGKSLLPQRIA